MSETILTATANNSNNNSGNNLPRGLMSKSGLPFNPNQRLPSLRSTLSKPSLLFQTSASFTHTQITSLNSSTATKSPVTNKRTYEPNANGPGDCAVTRRQGGEGKGFTNGVKQPSKNVLDSWKGSSSSTSSGRGRRQNVRKPKKLIQLESTVFTGASRTSIKVKSTDSPNSNKKSRSKKATISLPSFNQELSEDSIEPAYIEGKLYQDDFINRSGDEDDNSEHLPHGWESLSLPIVKEPVNTISEHWLTPDLMRDKLILFQLPKILENQKNMKLGKLRVYESGKVELVNGLSDFTFEVIKVGQSERIIESSTSSSSKLTASSTTVTSTSSDDDLNGRFSVKNETIKADYVEPKLNREVVTYSGRNLISIGKLESDAAIVIPKLFNNS